MNKIIINGKTIIAKNNATITMTGDKLTVDGRDVLKGETAREITLIVQGNVSEIKGVSTVMVNGDVNNVKTQSGNVEIGGNVLDSVKTMSGSVKVDGNITGNVKTMSGNIKYLK